MLAVTIGSIVLVFLVLFRVPIGFAMGLVGFCGFGYLTNNNWSASLTMATKIVSNTSQEYSLSIIPLFILMGNLMTNAKISNELYKVSYILFGHLKGGLAMATVVASGFFAAISGSSLATVATMSKVSMKPMLKYNYSPSLASASIAAGGTLGILIPPSVVLVIYGVITEQSIRELFAAGFIPGLLGVLFYIVAVIWTVKRDPNAGPAGKKSTKEESINAIKNIWGTIFLFTLVMGGIYLGIFTPTEAAGIGAAGAFFIALFKKNLTIKTFLETLAETSKTTISLFVIIIGALIFSSFVDRAGLTDFLLGIIESSSLHPLGVIFLMLFIYILLGAVFESLSMILLTVPIFFPIVEALGFDLVWFGILVVVVTEISLITPPLGMNVFILSNVSKNHVTTGTIFRGITPFLIVDIIRLLILTLIPTIILFLPELLYR